MPSWDERFKKEFDRYRRAYTGAAVVYFLLINRRTVKIGFTAKGADVRRHVGKLFNAERCPVLGIMPGDRHMEKIVHALFRAYRIERESFVDTAALRKFIAANCV